MCSNAVLQSISEALQASPARIVTDFELAILNACRQIFPDSPIIGCFFHLGQSVYRKVQAEGLQEIYNDPADREFKLHIHMMTALAFVPVEHVQEVFRLFKCKVPENVLPIVDYFEETYVLGRPGRGRRRAVPPRYPVPLWNQFQSATTGQHKTNNVSEGWHNRFRIVVGKHHPDIYSALKEFQKEQADVEISIAEIGLGRKVKAQPKPKWIEYQNKLKNIVDSYVHYREEHGTLEYLKALAHNIVISGF